MPERNSAIKSLGEVALRVNDLENMARFYNEVIGLAVLRRIPNAVFFSIAPDYGGHTQILALFDRSAWPSYQGLDAPRTTLDHLALTIDLQDYTSERQRLESLGVSVTAKEQTGFFWRSLFVRDPEGNAIELVCFDASVPEA